MKPRKLLLSATLLGFLGSFGAVSITPTVSRAAVVTVGHVKKVHKKPHKRRRKHLRHRHKKA